jgi:hypothetical protein
MKLIRSTKFALVVAALLASSPSFGQAPLIREIIYQVIKGGIILFTTTVAAEAKKKKQENPGAEIRQVYEWCTPAEARYNPDWKCLEVRRY